MKNKILLTTAVLSCIAPTLFAETITSGTDNTVAPTSTSTFVTEYKNNVDVRDSVVGGTMNTVRGNVDNSGANLVVGSENKVMASSSIVIGWKNKLEGNNAFIGGIEAEAKGDNTFAFGLKAKAIGEGNVAIGKYSNATGKDSMALGRDSIASANNTNALGQNAVASGENATALGHGSESTGRNSNAFGSSANASADSSTAVGNSAKAKGVSSTATGFNALANGNFSTAYGNDAQAKGNRSVAVGYNARAEESAVAIGNNSNAGAVNAVAVGAGNAVTGIKSSAFGVGNTVAQANTHVLGNEIATTQANSVVVGNKSTDRAATAEEEAEINGLKYGNFAGKGSVANGVMSIGSVGGERQLINVAAGKISADSTDTVNGSQLYAVAQNVSNVANSTKNVIGGNATVDQNGNITTNNIGGTGESTVDAAIKKVNNNYNSINSHITKLDQRVNKVGASTAALAALHPQDFNPNDKFSVAVGFGNYKDANSVAIGAFYRPNENTMLSIGTTMGSEKMFNAGLSLKFGHHDKMNSDTKVAVTKEVQDLARKYEDLSQKYNNIIKLLNKKEASEFKSDLSGVEENQQYKITRVDNSDTEKGRIERIKATRK